MTIGKKTRYRLASEAPIGGCRPTFIWFDLFQLELNPEESQSVVVEPGSSVKIRVSCDIPESHKFDPVSVEFRLPLLKSGNEDRQLLLQGKNQLVLVFVNKGNFLHLSFLPAFLGLVFQPLISVLTDFPIGAWQPSVLDY